MTTMIHPPDSASSSASSLKMLVVLNVLLLAAIGVLAGFEVFRALSPTTAWQYTIDSPSDDALMGRLQEMGGAGWEMVFARRATSSAGGGPSYEMIFRRPAAGHAPLVLNAAPKPGQADR
jgi:hypothetical protein